MRTAEKIDVLATEAKLLRSRLGLAYLRSISDQHDRSGINNYFLKVVKAIGRNRAFLSKLGSLFLSAFLTSKARKQLKRGSWLNKLYRVFS
ncbi:MAG: hypothetical protein WDW19_01210 [Neisseriaceae bacterium]